ncbi:molecular chaperone HtpG [Kangiella koreensis]|uniref:Chaperone protein HtpG n=1 Tax=Kangiella koreensis (strain DSM 16069 / JCM 12317 / KCTC 12182 / SW-125) TaxID=523791 RepID=C7RB07_KANKD|nr:molecular chaperone HtpG [Kangiella koreensis]ACV26449.1 heat shock protein Hsp90 [Kangiella koreensis DSM 16069]
MSVAAEKQTHSFQTEVKQLLHLMVHSLYSNKEIFLRELISNAADAADKLRFKALDDDSLLADDPELRIRITTDKDTKTLTITDNGIGMTEEEVIAHLGTIAKSGTADFLSQLTGDKKKDSKLIGQFGVGFYSAFIVADKVTVTTRGAGLAADQAVIWESAGDGQFTIEPTTKDARGTDITLHLKEGEEEFLEDYRLRTIIGKYSDHISLPVEMHKVSQEDDKEQPEKPEFEVVNKATALWTRPKSEITDEEYQEFYKHVAHDFQDALSWSHNQVEGKQEYTSLLYIPAKAPFDMWNRDRVRGVKLYVQRVFIMDDAEQFLPIYLRFVRGLIDSNDLPLNVSREILQDSSVTQSLRSATVSRVLKMLEQLAKKDSEKYQQFWDEFGQVLKEGPGEDFANKEKIAKLFRFSSTHTDSKEQTVSLDDYIERMKPEQDKIYYIATDSFLAAKNSPHLEIFRKKGIEVLLMHDRIDEWTVSHLQEYQGKQFVSVTQGSLDLGNLEDADDKKAQEEASKEHEELVKRVKDVLGDKVGDVRITLRLTHTPTCIVAGEGDMPLQIVKMMQAAGQPVPDVKPVFELNPEHALIQLVEKEQDQDQFNEWVEVLFDQAQLAEAGQLEDPASFATKLNKLLLKLAN